MSRNEAVITDGRREVLKELGGSFLLIIASGSLRANEHSCTLRY